MHYASSWLVGHFFLRNVISRRFFLLWRWKWHFCQRNVISRRFFIVSRWKRTFKHRSNIRKALSACFPNFYFIWSPYWSLSAIFILVLNNFFAWPLWYSPIHSAQTDLSQGMQWYSSFFFICSGHAQYTISPLVRLSDVKETTTWQRVSFFLSMSFPTCFTKMARTCFAEELGRSFFAIFTL